MAAFFIFEGTGLVCERVYFDSATIRRQLTAEDWNRFRPVL